LFWMYNDSWGEVGWTIIDYYLRRKPSWYFVRRAFAPLRLIMRPAGSGQGNGIRVVMANDTDNPLSFELEYGYVSLDGRVTDLKRVWGEAAALERTELCTFDRGSHDPRSGLWVARAPGHADIDPAIFRAVDFRQLYTTAPKLRLAEATGAARGSAVQVSSDAFAHAVHLVLPSGVLPSDDYFDLLPGESREVALTSEEPVDLAAISLSCVNR
jgi:beta-mannosidase